MLHFDLICLAFYFFCCTRNRCCFAHKGQLNFPVPSRPDILGCGHAAVAKSTASPFEFDCDPSNHAHEYQWAHISTMATRGLSLFRMATAAFRCGLVPRVPRKNVQLQPFRRMQTIEKAGKFYRWIQLVWSKNINFKNISFYPFKVRIMQLPDEKRFKIAYFLRGKINLSSFVAMRLFMVEMSMTKKLFNK